MHGLLFFLCAALITQRAARIPIPPPILVELTRNIQKREEKPSSQDEKFKKQVVQTSRGEEVKVPMRDAFLGERNQVVDRQMVSRAKTTVMGGGEKTAPSKPRAKSEEKSADSSVLGSFGLPILQQLRQKNTDLLRESAPANWADAGQLPQDFVKGLQQGERTALNTREFVFYGYYQRIRDRLDRAWVPILREKLIRHYRSGRQLASEMDYITRVLVTLNVQGEIVRVQLLGKSGTGELDEAAVKAFNRAGPFPNPPKGIVDANGEIQIPWEFILKT